MIYLKTLRYAFFITFLLALTLSAWALPIDWNGNFGIDTTLIDNYRKIKSTADNSGTSQGSQEIGLADGGHANASFQSYLFQLSPVLIINDSTSLFGEITTGYGRGGRFGDSSIQSQEDSFGNALYLHNTTDTSNGLILTKLHMILYSDTATYIIGRHSKHWGLGAIMNNGEQLWDRHSSTRDGVTMKLKIGNFQLSPYWAKISSANSLTRATKVKEYGLSALYNNTEKDLSFGLHYNKKINDAHNQSIKTDINNTGTAYSFGRTDIKLVDLYLRKAFGPINIAFEFPLISGEIGDIYQNTKSTKYKAKAIIFESSYQVNESWKVGVNLGHVDGDSGSGSSFEAMFLNPNYQIANLMFRYNMRAVSDPDNLNIYDSYVTNARYAKLFGEFSYHKWLFSGAFIYATALEAAKNGQSAYNHTNNKIFDANTDQSTDLGHEIDLGIDYQWNNEVKLGASMGYHFVGNYYAFTNSSGVTNNADNSFVGQLNAAMEF